MEDEEKLDVTKLKYVLYARKSTDDPLRQATSIPDQIDECIKLARRVGIHIVGEPIEESRSAKTPNNRPKFDQMLRDIRSGKYDGILAWNPDRLARNMLEAGMIIDMVDQGIIKDLKFATHYFTKDANGKMLLGMAFVLSKQYSDKLSQDVTRGVKGRFVKYGKTPTPKHGYVNENGVYKPDNEIKENGYSNFDLICEAWLMRKRGDSIEAITEYLNNAGYYRLIKENNRKVDMDKRILSEIFHDSFYYGVLVQVKQSVDLREMYSDFMPAVSEDDYWAVQSLTYRKIKPTKPHKTAFYPLRLMVYCSYCNKSMVVAPSKSSSGKKYLYYRCDNKDCNRSPKSIRAKVIFSFIYDLLEDGLNFTEKEYNEYYDNLIAITDEERQASRAQLHNKQGLLKHTKREITELSLSLSHLPSGRPKEEVLNKITSLEDDEAELETEIDKLEKLIRDPQQDKMSIEQFLNLSNNASMIVQSADERIKDIICRQIFLNFTVDKSKVLSYQAKEPFATLIKQRQQRSSRGPGN